MARILAALRLSRVTEASVSLEKQTEIINAWALAHDHQIVGWASDPGVSGDVSPFDRPELGAWLQPDRADDFDMIVSWKIDRISRRLSHFAALLDWAEKGGKYIVAISDGVDTSTKIGRMLAQLLTIFAEMELSSIKERIAGTKAHLRTSNRFTGGSPPFGYKVEPLDPANPKAGKCLVIDPDTSKIVNDMVAAILAGGSIADVRRDLEERAIPSPRGTEWSGRSITDILRSRSLLGQKVSSGKIVRGEDGLPLQRAEPLITQDEFDRLQAALDQAAKPVVFNNPKSVLADVLHCGCGSKVTRQVQRNGGRQYAYYRCTKKCGQPVGVRAEIVDRAVEQAVMRALGKQQRLVRRWVPGSDNSEALGQVDQAIAGLREEHDLGLYEGDRQGYLTRLQGLTARRRELAALPVRAGGWSYEPTGQTYREAWEALAVAGRRELLLSSGIVAHATPGDTGTLVTLCVPGGLVQRLAGQDDTTGATITDSSLVKSGVTTQVKWLGVTREKAAA